MKFQLLTLALVAMFLIVHCVPVNLRYLDNKILFRLRRSPDHAMMFTPSGGEFGLMSEDVVPNGDDSVYVPQQYPEENQNRKAESEEYDDSNDSPISQTNMRRQPPVSNFFPIMFGSGNGRSGGAPSGATAIANSFSTGKHGVATSHATAYGDPSAAVKHQNENGQV